MSYCTQQAWIDNNQPLSYWTDTYPFLKNTGFPLSMSDLQDFYVSDMQNRNLTPLQSYYDCYEFLFSYFLAQFPEQNNPTRFKGKTFLEYSADNLGVAISKTFTDFGNQLNNLTTSILGVSPLVLIIIIVALFFIIKEI